MKKPLEEARAAPKARSGGDLSACVPLTNVRLSRGLRERRVWPNQTPLTQEGAPGPEVAAGMVVGGFRGTSCAYRPVNNSTAQRFLTLTAVGVWNVQFLGRDSMLPPQQTVFQWAFQ